MATAERGRERRRERERERKRKRERKREREREKEREGERERKTFPHNCKQNALTMIINTVTKLSNKTCFVVENKRLLNVKCMAHQTLYD